ncbi:hypothetical protein [Pseudoxanthomonas mexicana]|uniref:hypothetical protein n=1 Tax=Pseudoxanthomonas mexicana TaxID=128785 RepID=UPI001FD70E42|nr:hypothetical protein [Pseudoxanthomonas mexicana]UOV02098.1 hypothetical protein MUU73_02085 [Pseudoxanthomonas mexicana]
MDWERVNIWTTTLYTLIHSLHLAREQSFGDLSSLDSRVRESDQWIQPECSYQSTLLAHDGGTKALTFRREPESHFHETAAQVVKMLVQDLVVIFDQMMDEALAARGEQAGVFPQSKIEKLRKTLKPQYQWAADGCLELIAARNVLTHADGLWNQKSIDVVKSILDQPPAVGDELVIGFSMLFRYRKAMRTLLNEVSPAA